ncbi:mitochondrial inner membrane i-AAA proteasecomplex subunit MGR1 [Striga asiatica]|uniref:Mitochondrial inner membrane i-AAA proteasecomplex subunit MGR1 n=1 Tax=Striga asiatica TaxID=4170 RepID=A0A5A7PEJ7_STRAF|nr:mitochondrial inner membrane i-AAA proteasecomplex subunit MGR1 [Striga asiatica]
MGQAHSRAGPPSHPKRHQLCRPNLSSFETLRNEAGWVIPNLGVPVDGPRVDHQDRPTWYVVPSDGTITRCFVRYEQWRCREQSEVLRDNVLKIRTDMAHSIVTDVEADLVEADGLERVEPRGGEDLDGGEPPEVPPVIAVGGADEGGVVVAEVLAGDETGTVGKDDVFFGEAFMDEVRGGDDDHEAVDEAEGEDGAHLLG